MFRRFKCLSKFSTVSESRGGISRIELESVLEILDKAINDTPKTRLTPSSWPNVTLHAEDIPFLSKTSKDYAIDGLLCPSPLFTGESMGQLLDQELSHTSSGTIFKDEFDTEVNKLQVMVDRIKPSHWKLSRGLAFGEDGNANWLDEGEKLIRMTDFAHLQSKEVVRPALRSIQFSGLHEKSLFEVVAKTFALEKEASNGEKLKVDESTSSLKQSEGENSLVSFKDVEKVLESIIEKNDDGYSVDTAGHINGKENVTLKARSIIPLKERLSIPSLELHLVKHSLLYALCRAYCLETAHQTRYSLERALLKEGKKIWMIGQQLVVLSFNKIAEGDDTMWRAISKNHRCRSGSAAEKNAKDSNATISTKMALRECVARVKEAQGKINDLVTAHLQSVASSILNDPVLEILDEQETDLHFWEVVSTLRLGETAKTCKLHYSQDNIDSEE